MVESICSAILSVRFDTNPVKKPTDCRDYVVYLSVQGYYKLQFTIYKFKINIQGSTSCLEPAVILNQPEKTNRNMTLLKI